MRHGETPSCRCRLRACRRERTRDRALDDLTGIGGPSRDADPVSEEQRRPIGEVLGGLGIHPLSEEEEAVEAFVLLKVRTKNGDTSWSYRTTGEPNREELLGALLVQADLIRHELRSEWEVD